MKILVFPVTVPLEETVKRLKKREKKLGEFFSIEVVYVPFWFFTFNYTIRKDQKKAGTTIIAADTILGEVAFFQGKMKNVKEVEVSENHILTPTVKFEEAAKKAEEELKRQIFNKFLWRIQKIMVKLKEAQLIYLPFWIGYYKTRENTIQIEVVNALSGEIGDAWYEKIICEGLKVKHTRASV